MKIVNDKISFDAADFDELSDFSRKALPIFVGERIEFANVFADLLNAQVEQAKQSLAEKTRADADVSAVLRKLAAADPAKYDEALTAIESVLASVVAPFPLPEPVVAEPEPTPAPVVAEPEKSEPADESLWTKITSIFK